MNGPFLQWTRLKGSLRTHAYRSPAEQADNPVTWLGDNVESSGEWLNVTYERLKAIVGAKTGEGVAFVVRELLDKGLIDCQGFDFIDPHILIPPTVPWGSTNWDQSPIACRRSPTFSTTSPPAAPAPLLTAAQFSRTRPPPNRCGDKLDVLGVDHALARGVSKSMTKLEVCRRISNPTLGVSSWCFFLENQRNRRARVLDAEIVCMPLDRKGSTTEPAREGVLLQSLVVTCAQGVPAN